LPVPRLIVLKIDRSKPLDASALRQKLSAVQGASLDDHRVWLQRLALMAGTVVVVAVVIFTVVFALLQPFLAVQFRRMGSGVIGAVALIATLVSLIVTDLLTDGLSISGVTTWILAALIVWLAALVAALVLPFLGLKKYLEERRT